MMSSFILMRHGVAQHNKVKQQMREKYPNQNVKSLPFYRGSKLSNQYMDSPLSQIGQQQSSNCSKLLEQYDIGVIIVSPLRRCLQTSQIITLNWKNKPKVIVQPLLANRGSYSWSLDWKLSQSKNIFNEYDFSVCQSLSNQQYETLMSMKLQNKQQLIRQSEQNEQRQEKQNVAQFKDIVEPYEQFKIRMSQLICNLSKYRALTNQKILIISHSSLFKFILADQFECNGKPKSKFQFQHCTPVFVSQQMIFKVPKL